MRRAPFLGRPIAAHLKRIVETTAESGLLDSRDGPNTGRLSNLAVFADVDNDGDLDIFNGAFIDANTDAVAAAKDRSELLLNDGKGHFTFAPRSKPRRWRCRRRRPPSTTTIATV